MQLSRDRLVEAYRLMRTIRAFEDRVNQEMASGDIPGAVHLLCRSGSLGGRRLHALG